MTVRYSILKKWPAYRVGTDGSVWSRWKRPRLGYGDWKRLKCKRSKDGYATFCVYDGKGTRKSLRVSNTMLRIFKGPPPSRKHECLHKDGDNSNNSLTNLKWGTRLDNAKDREKHGKTAINMKHGKTKIPIQDVRRLMSLKGKQSAKSTAEQFNLSQQYVGQLWNGKRTRRGF